MLLLLSPLAINAIKYLDSQHVKNFGVPVSGFHAIYSINQLTTTLGGKKGHKIKSLGTIFRCNRSEKVNLVIGGGFAGVVYSGW